MTVAQRSVDGFVATEDVLCRFGVGLDERVERLVQHVARGAGHRREVASDQRLRRRRRP